mgnify:CR=1 FL=1
MATTLRYLRIHEQFFVFSRRAPYMVLRDTGDDAADADRHERDRMVAQLCVDLIERYGYRLSQLHVRELVPIVSQEGWQYPEADLLIEGNGGNPRLLVKAMTSQQYETALETGIAELFLLARAIPSRRTTPLFIIPYTRRRERRATREKFLVINAAAYGSMDAWIAAGRPTESAIPPQA